MNDAPDMRRDDSEKLVRIVYLSSATAEMTDADHEAILSVSRKNNVAAGITGMLLSSHEKNLQLIEGETTAVNALYAKIEKDPRHQHLEVLQHQPINKRSFPKWAMSYKKVTDSQFYEAFYNFCQDIGYSPAVNMQETIPGNIAILLETYRSRVSSPQSQSFVEKRRLVAAKYFNHCQ